MFRHLNASLLSERRSPVHAAALISQPELGYAPSTSFAAIRPTCICAPRRPKRGTGNIEFDIEWDSFAAPRHRLRLSAAQPRNRVQSHRERLRRKRLSTASGRRSQSPAPAQECDSEAVRRFNEFWNSLAPSRTPQRIESSAPASVAALPMSLGLVKLLEAVEAAVQSRCGLVPEAVQRHCGASK